jgi:hypothetical protein
MATGARTPEELETLLEDALLLGDERMLASLFEDGAVLVVDGRARQARGADDIARLAMTVTGSTTYIADPRRLLQARETTLVVSDGAINVARRGHDGVWRYAISLLSTDTPITKEKT